MALRPKPSAIIQPTSHSPLAASRQLLLVLADSWRSTDGRLQRFARAHAGADWQLASEAIPVKLGRSGLAWGRGLHPTGDIAGPEKCEGDGCAPAGIFAITGLFGEERIGKLLVAPDALPFCATHANLKGVDDPESRHYNRIVDQRSIVAPDWRTCEEMLRADERYAVGAIIAHNSDPVVAGAGSCIFLHVRDDGGKPTAGCTAGDFPDILAVCAWLRQAARPLLVQLPRGEYKRLKPLWNLP